MLGPNDVEDWGESEDDRVRAEIRLLPIMHEFRQAPRPAAALLGRDLAKRVRKFQRESQQSQDFLMALLHDLREAMRRSF